MEIEKQMRNSVENNVTSKLFMTVTHHSRRRSRQLNTEANLDGDVEGNKITDGVYNLMNVNLGQSITNTEIEEIDGVKIQRPLALTASYMKLG